MEKKIRILVVDNEERALFDSTNFMQNLYVYVYNGNKLLYTSKDIMEKRSAAKPRKNSKVCTRKTSRGARAVVPVEDSYDLRVKTKPLAFSERAGSKKRNSRTRRTNRNSTGVESIRKVEESVLGSTIVHKWSSGELKNGSKIEESLLDTTQNKDLGRELPQSKDLGGELNVSIETSFHVANRVASTEEKVAAESDGRINKKTDLKITKGGKGSKHAGFNAGPMFCNICGVQYKSQMMLDKHKEVHIIENTDTENPLQCTICQKVYPTWRSLTIHKRKHGAAKSNVCDKCGKGFRTKQELVRHEYAHSNHKSSPCHICGKLFKNKAYAQMHSKLHSAENRKHVCKLCGKNFLRGPDIQKHMRIHTGEKPFICSHCGRSFSESSHLIRHERLHTGEKPYKCDKCGQRFTHKEVLTRHSFIHMEHLPFSCDVCSKGFKTKRELDNHWLVHDKPTDSSLKQPCKVCGKVFSHQLYLHYHMRAHTNLGNFECPVCTKVFKKSGYLKQHIINQHPHTSDPETATEADSVSNEHEIGRASVVLSTDMTGDSIGCIQGENSNEAYVELSKDASHLLFQDINEKLQNENGSVFAC